MNGLERMLAAVRFTPGDRPPVAPQLFGHAARWCGVPLRDYVQDGALMADCQLRTQARYGHDAVFAFMDFGLESEAIGSRLRFYEEQYPEITDYVLPPGADAVPVEPGRYRLVAARACPWANRSIIVRRLLGLDVLRRQRGRLAVPL